MKQVSIEQIRWFRLASHHLDRWYQKERLVEAVGVIGMQNSPPGAWETSLFNRIEGIESGEIERMLYREKSLLQAWSYRGVPVIFPRQESSTFLTSLIPKSGEEWIYTRGIGLATEYLEMRFDDLLDMLLQVLPRLDHVTIQSKRELDQFLADEMQSLIPSDKKERWNAPSMYGRPDMQTVGGAVVSFLLRPSSLLGMVVFGERIGMSPTFTSYRNWTGGDLRENSTSEKSLARKFLHAYGPSTTASFAAFLGATSGVARRIWDSISGEIAPVMVNGKRTYILESDREALDNAGPPERELLLLGAHDPYLDLRDRHFILEDKTHQRKIWQTVSNPGAILKDGVIIGFWKSKKKGKGISLELVLWGNADRSKLKALSEAWAFFRGEEICSLLIQSH
ncbi:MAG: winged helix DNA-binding domain-containing protein [Tissierellia bacterium]|nr:winged helix DNA-binding domain-containing protein [Tissierellia bacterium]